MAVPTATKKAKNIHCVLSMLRVATYNIHRCVGRDGKKDPTRIAAVLREIGADIIALQEVSSVPGHTTDVLALFAKATNSEAIQGFTLQDRHSHYGNALLTRQTVTRIKRFNISVPGREPRGVIDVVLVLEGRTVQLLATHLGLLPSERRFQIERIMPLLEAATADVSILLGDFNEWFLWGQPLRRLQKWFTTGPAPATFPARWPLLSLDRIWVHPSNSLASLWVHRTVLSRIASDHLPLVADVSMST